MTESNPTTPQPAPKLTPQADDPRRELNRRLYQQVCSRGGTKAYDKFNATKLSYTVDLAEQLCALLEGTTRPAASAAATTAAAPAPAKPVSLAAQLATIKDPLARSKFISANRAALCREESAKRNIK